MTRAGRRPPSRAGAASAQVYKCPGPGGQTVFQQSPCAGGKELNVKPVQEVGGTYLGGQTAQGAADVDRRLAILGAAERGEPAVGMTVDQLERAMGAPQKVNVANYGGGPEEQRIYRRDGRTYYVYTRGGQVSGIQNQETGRPKPACPSARELRDAELVVVHTSHDGTDDGFAHYKVEWNQERFVSPRGKGEIFEVWGADAGVELVEA